MWQYLGADQLVGQVDVERAKAVFKRGVRLVEIEVFSYCNRRCWFCPNAKIDRITSNSFMPEAMYTGIVDQLQTIGFDGTISYSRYNEPFADDIIFERIAEARQKLPAALLHTNSNGDYLNPEKLERAYAAGLRSLNIQLYLKNDELYDHEKTRFRAAQIAERLPLNYQLVRDEPGEWLEYNSQYKDMALRVYGRNFASNGTNRGEQVDIHADYVRTSPCIMPFWAVYIDYDGKTMPCCNFRSDIGAHEPYIISDLALSHDIFLNYMNDRATAFRRSLLNNDVKDGLCRSCHFVLETVDEGRMALMSALQEQAAQLHA